METQAPSGAVTARARFVWANVTDGTSIGCRQVKLERGRLPATAYTTESALVDANAQIATKATARANADSALSTSISQVSARLNTGGDVQTAIVQAQSTATATAGKIATSYGVTLSSNGYISGLKSYNDGSTSQFRVTADQVFIGASNMVRDEGFYSPSWWFHGAQTAWPSNFIPCDSTSGDGMPGRYLKITPGTYVEAVSQAIPSDAGAAYRVRLRIYRSADFVGKVACCALFPSSAWGQPGPVGSNTIATSLGNVPCLSNTEGLGTLQTYTGIWTGNPSYSYLNACIFASVTAGFCSVWLEVVRATGTDMIVDGSITANQIAAGAVNAAKIQAGAVSADKIAVSTLSAISAALGTIVSAVVELVSSGWSYIRTSSKWWADGVDGFIQGASSTLGYFQEFRASSGNALILEQKANGTGTGWKYYLQVRDGAGVDRMVIDPATGSYKFKGTVYADAGTFAGALQAATGTFSGSLTASAVNAVSRINIAGESISIIRGVQGKALVFSPLSLADGESASSMIFVTFTLPYTTSGGDGEQPYEYWVAVTVTVTLNGSGIWSSKYEWHTVNSLPFVGPFTVQIPCIITKGDVIECGYANSIAVQTLMR